MDSATLWPKSRALDALEVDTIAPDQAKREAGGGSVGLDETIGFGEMV